MPIISSTLSSPVILVIDLSHIDNVFLISLANLSLVNFQGAKLDGANFKGAIFVASEQNKADQFIAKSDETVQSIRLKKVDFSNSLNLDSNQIQYICSQGGIHPNCPSAKGKK
jgi:hypothetical protein